MPSVLTRPRYRFKRPKRWIPIAGTGTVPSAAVVTNGAWVFSPYNWRKSGSAYAETNNPGAYFKTKFSGTSVGLTVDVSMLSGAGVAANRYPIIAYSVDGAAYTYRQLLSSDSTITLGTGLASATHTLKVFHASVYGQIDAWTTPVAVLRVTALVLDSGAVLSAPDTYTDYMVVYGDSHLWGAEALAYGDAASGSDATQTFGMLMGRAFECEVGCIGWPGQSYTAGGASGSNVPGMHASWSLYSNGNSRLSGGLFAPQPDYIVCAHGDNQSSGTETDIAAQIAAWRAAAPDAAIFICQAPNRQVASTIADGVTLAADANTYLIDHEENLLTGHPGEYQNGDHLNVRGHARFAAADIRLMQEAIGGTGGGTSSGISRNRVQRGM